MQHPKGSKKQLHPVDNTAGPGPCLSRRTLVARADTRIFVSRSAS